MLFCPYCGGSLKDRNIEQSCLLCGRELPEELVSRRYQDSTNPLPEHTDADACEKDCAVFEEENATFDDAVASVGSDDEGMLEDGESSEELSCSNNPFPGSMDIYEQRLANAKSIIDHGFSNLRRKNSPDPGQDRSNACSDFRQAAENLFLARADLLLDLNRYGVLFWLNAKKGKHNVYVLETNKPSLSQYIDFHYDNALLSEEERRLASIVRANGNDGSHYGEVEQGCRKTIDYRDAKRAGISVQKLLALSALDQLLDTFSLDVLEERACAIRNTLVRFYLDTSSVEDLRARLQRKADKNKLDDDGHELLQKCDDLIDQHVAVANESIQWLSEHGFEDDVEEAVSENNMRICESICEKLEREIVFMERKAAFIERCESAYERKAGFVNRNWDNKTRSFEVGQARKELRDMYSQIQEAKCELRQSVEQLYGAVDRLDELGDDHGRFYRSTLDGYRCASDASESKSIISSSSGDDEGKIYAFAGGCCVLVVAFFCLGLLMYFMGIK